MRLRTGWASGFRRASKRRFPSANFLSLSLHLQRFADNFLCLLLSRFATRSRNTLALVQPLPHWSNDSSCTDLRQRILENTPFSDVVGTQSMLPLAALGQPEISKTPPKFNEKTTKREKRNENGGGSGKKSTKIWASRPSGPQGPEGCLFFYAFCSSCCFFFCCEKKANRLKLQFGPKSLWPNSAQICQSRLAKVGHIFVAKFGLVILKDVRFHPILNFGLFWAALSKMFGFIPF